MRIISPNKLQLAFEELPRDEQWFRRMVENSRDGISLLDFETGRYIFVSPAQVQLTGFSEEELLDITVETFLARVHPGDRDLFSSLQKLVGEGQEDGAIEYRWKVKSGEYRWFSDRRKNILAADGHAVATIGIMRDITDQKHAEEELEKAKSAAEAASTAKSEFLGMMNHEIRTPLAIFMAAIQHLLELDRDPERCLLLRMAEQSAQRLCSLIDDILDLSRIEARRLALEEEVFYLRACVGEAVGKYALRAREKDLRVEVNVSPEVPEAVVGDSHKLRQVLSNLIDNAVKFTRVGEIRIDVGSCGKILEFSVADTGIGLAEGKLNLLFQSFNQFDSSDTRKFGGAGLGLAISKGLVELMGGQIWAQNRECQGSIFTFTLPLKTPGK